MGKTYTGKAAIKRGDYIAIEKKTVSNVFPSLEIDFLLQIVSIWHSFADQPGHSHSLIIALLFMFQGIL